MKYLYENRKNLSKFFCYASIFCSSCWSLYLLLSPMGFIFCMEGSPRKTVTVALIFTPMYYLGLVGVYVLLVGRLYYTFERNPGLQVSRRLLGVLLVPIPIYVILYIFLNLKIAPKQSSSTSIVIVACATILYVTSHIILVSMFLRKLIHLASTRYSVATNPGNTVELTSQQMNLIRIMTKYTLLAFIALVSTCITVVVIAISLQLRNPHLHMELFLFASIAVDCVINLVCLFLSFSFAEPHYQQVCFCLHSLILKKFQFRVVRAHAVP
ncbi:hypothetical protein RFI_13747 [Reticulomyxa filosa]|uniref:G-protein coupled receptors family 1 profile domain-containing protein n=1 Tax=Reticulomyxa filosa TaxID=46433 RepID=X6NBS1_RETFI|nr:hypothetical protein RFI_13747 [Reticulomyxa filosa]|eukprot:ETO23436.1 hypothetical protein RFI_13747 [Reticulomyxa filosa]